MNRTIWFLSICLVGILIWVPIQAQTTQGYVLMAKGNLIYTDLNAQTGIQVGDRLQVFQNQTFIHPVTKAKMEDKIDLCIIRVIKVSDMIAIGQIVGNPAIDIGALNQDAEKGLIRVRKVVGLSQEYEPPSRPQQEYEPPTRSQQEYGPPTKSRQETFPNEGGRREDMDGLSREWKIRQLRNSSRLFKLAAVLDFLTAGSIVYYGSTVYSIDAGTGVTYFIVGGAAVVGGIYLWRTGSANSSEADRMEQQLLRSENRALFHLGDGRLTMEFPQAILYANKEEYQLHRKSIELRTTLLTYVF